MQKLKSLCKARANMRSKEVLEHLTLICQYKQHHIHALSTTGACSAVAIEWIIKEDPSIHPSDKLTARGGQKVEGDRGR